jgi:hypothetical protein
MTRMLRSSDFRGFLKSAQISVPEGIRDIRVLL